MPRLIHKIDENLSTVRTNIYPKKVHYYVKNRHNILLGIGGNMGDVTRRFEHLYIFLVKSPLVTLIETSPILRNPPFGYLKQDDFFNAVIHIQSDLSPMALLNYILEVERRFGRRRSFSNAPRTLDIDMIFYDDIVMNKPRLQLPHPHWQKRESVTIPLSHMKGKRWSKRHL